MDLSNLCVARIATAQTKSGCGVSRRGIPPGGSSSRCLCLRLARLSDVLSWSQHALGGVGNVLPADRFGCLVAVRDFSTPDAGMVAVGWRRSVISQLRIARFLSEEPARDLSALTPAAAQGIEILGDLPDLQRRLTVLFANRAARVRGDKPSETTDHQ